MRRYISMKITRFDNSHASLYILENSRGMEVALTDIGASIVSIKVPDRSGSSVDVALGYEGAEGYFRNALSYGAVVGRFANRIGGAVFSLNGVEYPMDVNDGPNVLHGGFDKYYHRMWYAEPDEASNSVSFKLVSPDGDQGMPGRALICVRYTLDEDSALHIAYDAVSDKDTFFNLTNHCYFNLNGHDKGFIGDHVMQLNCGSFTPVDATLIPTGEIRSVSGTPLDFTSPKPIGRDIDSDYEQIQLGGGFDHNFVLSAPGLDAPFAVVKAPETGIVMEVFTDLPGVQFYSGNFMGSDVGEKGGKYIRRGGFCLETQFFPDTPNKPDFPGSLFAAGEKLVSETVYKFSVE